MREYAEEGIEHFYFMMPRTGYLSLHSSSTQRSAVASAVSVNHSCAPNCYVANGRLGSTFRWAYSQIVRSRRMRN
ncbi:hypothetical protein DFH94DRAFT_706306 [Russula ochroleuca]|uniref:SET domain-containing protein n=1 Tax=Russula ochroleuca TaxID=152965 RepID=A0A9P5TEW9_9AGAM|nr:hypothetical protein DFH94DRAFT_706306 [Russula ochroleuca]